MDMALASQVPYSKSINKSFHKVVIVILHCAISLHSIYRLHGRFCQFFLNLIFIS